jgi:hypothetical protein
MLRFALDASRYDTRLGERIKGTKSGKAFGRPRTAPDVERIRDALATPGRPGFHKIAAQFGVATGTVQRIAAGPDG